MGRYGAQRLALAQLLAQRHGEKATDRLRKLAENADEFSDSDRLQLWAGLVDTAIQMGDTKQARQLCERIAAKDPNNVQVRFVLFEQAVRAQDDAGMEQALKEIERVAGKGAYWLYGQAVRLSMQAKGKKRADRDRLQNEALDLLARAREASQNWPQIPLLMAAIYDEQGKSDLALKNYQEAIDMGEHDPAAVQRTVQLLFQKQQFGEADRLLRQLDQQQVPFSPDMNRASAEAALRQGDFDRALEAARKAAASDSKRYQDQMWLGQMLSLIGRRAKTEGQGQKAERSVGGSREGPPPRRGIGTQTPGNLGGVDPVSQFMRQGRPGREAHRDSRQEHPGETGPAGDRPVL